MTKTTYHVYTESGFVSGHRSKVAAIKVAKRSAKSGYGDAIVVATDVHGMTGHGKGHTVFSTAQ